MSENSALNAITTWIYSTKFAADNFMFKLPDEIASYEAAVTDEFQHEKREAYKEALEDILTVIRDLK